MTQSSEYIKFFVITMCQINFFNSQKTKSMLITGKRLRNLVASTSIDVSLNGSNIEHVTDFKLLGIILDQDISFNRQIKELCKKLAKRIGLLRHIPYWYLISGVLNFAILARQYFAGFYFRDFNRQI